MNISVYYLLVLLFGFVYIKHRFFCISFDNDTVIVSDDSNYNVTSSIDADSIPVNNYTMESKIMDVFPSAGGADLFSFDSEEEDKKFASTLRKTSSYNVFYPETRGVTSKMHSSSRRRSYDRDMSLTRRHRHTRVSLHDRYIPLKSAAKRAFFSSASSFNSRKYVTSERVRRANSTQRYRGIPGAHVDTSTLPYYKVLSPLQRTFHRRSLLVQSPEEVSCPSCLLYFDGTLYRYPVYWSPSLFVFNGTIDVTSVFILTSERLDFIPHLLKRWPGNMVFVLYVKEYELDIVLSRVTKQVYPSRVQLLILSHRRRSTFPINYLRNLGIAIVTTSHFVVLDMDMWPAPNLYKELISLPPEYTTTESAVIIPAVFLASELVKKRCDSLTECAAISMQLFPNTKDELRDCLKRGTCRLTKHLVASRNHLLLDEEWAAKDSPAVTRVNCFPNRFQEPYVMLRKEFSKVWFSQQFINYGCNKVQMIEHLRATNHKFFILHNSFATDIAHHDSRLRRKYINDGATRMRGLCYRYLAQIDMKYGSDFVTPLCASSETTV